MVQMIASAVITAAIFFAIVFSLALRPSIIQRNIGYAIGFALISGLLIYGLGFAYGAKTPGEVVAAAVQATFSTASMFVGKNDYSAISKAVPQMSDMLWLRIWFWLAHLLAMYAMASAALSTLGRRLLQRLRRQLLFFKDTLLIYGISDDSIDFAHAAGKQKGTSIIIVGDRCSSSQSTAILELGATQCPESFVMHSQDQSWLKKVGITARGKKNIEIVSFSENTAAAQKFLKKVSSDLVAQKIPVERVRFSVRCDSVFDFTFLQTESGFNASTQKEDAYYTVNLFSRSELVARQLMRTAPPYRTMSFREDCSARNDFSTLIIGFGDVGQSVLRHLVMNGQFLNSNFSATVIDKSYQSRAGAFCSSYAEMIRHYDITFSNDDALSSKFWEDFTAKLSKVNYIVVCTGDSKENAELAVMLRNQLAVNRQRDPENSSPTILAECSKSGLILHDCLENNPCLCYDNKRMPCNHFYSTLSPADILCGKIDRMAYAVNATYVNPNVDAILNKEQSFEDFAAATQAAFDKQSSSAIAAEIEASWKSADPFTRDSNRASAEYIGAMLAALGVPQEEQAVTKANTEKIYRVIQKASPECLKHLGQVEHLRWLAFHYANGVSAMSPEEMKARAAKGEKNVHKNIPPFGLGGQHICMVDWDALDQIDKYYDLYRPQWADSDTDQKQLVKSDLKQLDRNNVIRIPCVYIAALQENTART